MFLCLNKVSFAVNTCEINKPPANSAVSENHGEYFFIFPRFISADFSGCQIMWDEAGKKYMTFKFSNGVLDWYQIHQAADITEPVRCSYVLGKQSDRSRSDCSSYDSVKKGLLNVAPEDEPTVPQSRDPRSKATLRVDL